MRWDDLIVRHPELADLGRRRLEDAGVVLVCTIRADGMPRLSPVEPIFWRGELWLCLLQDSWKARDLRRDQRLLVHNIVKSKDGDDGELKLVGRAVEETDPEVQGRFSRVTEEKAGWTPQVGRFHLFRLDIESVTFIRYDPSTGDQYAQRWPDGEGMVRRATSATSLGPPEASENVVPPT